MIQTINDEKIKKFIFDPDNYIMTEYIDGSIYLEKINVIVIDNIEDVCKYDFKHSKISECLINTILYKRLKYKSILECVYLLINNGVTIIKTH